MSRFLRFMVLVIGLALSSGASAQAISQAEEAMFLRAQQSGLFTEYEAYLAAYPEGAFVEIARFEMKWSLSTPGQENVQTGIGFETPLRSEDPGLAGKSIADLIEMSPYFAPIEGLPEVLWKEQPCAGCHAWTKKSLCDQGMTYTGVKGSKSLNKPHPFGGLLKSAMRTFAVEGCR